MRTLVLLACSGCLISEPQGAAQSWPPSLGGTVEEVVAGDLDSDGATDVVVMMSGTKSRSGLYLLESDVDILYDTTDNVRSFSRFVPMELFSPVGAMFEQAAEPRIYVASGEDDLWITVLSNTLEETDWTRTSVPSSGTTWIRPIAFPGGMAHKAVSNGSVIEHVDPSLTDTRPLPPPDSPAWDLAQTVTSYTDGGSTIAVVATATTIYRSAIPTTAGAPFSWEVVRTGTPWLGQVAHDLDGDGRIELLGFDAMAHRLCVVDVQTAAIPVATPSCIQLSSTFTGTDVTIIAGQNLSMDPGKDVLVIQASGMGTNYSLVDGITYGGGMIAAMSDVAIPFVGPARGRSVIVTPSPGRPVSLLTFGTDGAAVCALGPC